MSKKPEIVQEDVANLIRDTLCNTVLEPVVDSIAGSVYGGKMIRTRMGLHLGLAAGVDAHTLLHAMGAVEMTHAASLLHDDVIDGGVMRRGAPAFWVERGAAGAVILGDLCVCKAFELIMQTENRALLAELVSLAGEMCEGEASQELLLRDQIPSWAASVDIARKKTGALFAFVGCASGGSDKHLAAALKESGYEIGTAYQLADDILDAFGDTDAAGKTLGTDEAGSKITAAATWQDEGVDPKSCITDLCTSASERLKPWPEVRQAWDSFIEEEFNPVITSFLGSFCVAEHK